MIDLEASMRVESVANKTEHWSKKFKRNKNQELIIKFMLIGQEKLKMPVRITLTRVAPRALDYDNLISACKHYVDVISDWIYPGLQPGRADGMKGMEWHYKQEKGRPKEYLLKINIISVEDSQF
jgi:hypothetical protein